jgi:hypothetical protein
MPASFHTARTLNGLKNRAEILAAEHSIGHMKALEMAAKEIGFSGYKKAQQTLPIKMVVIQVKARWQEKNRTVKGCETIEYPFASPLAQMLLPAKGRRRQRLGIFVTTTPNVLDLDMVAGTQEEARRMACMTIRRLMFMEALNVTQAPSGVVGWTLVSRDGGVPEPVRMPGTDHHGVWVTQEGALFIVNEPYTDNPNLDLQESWCLEHGFEMVTPIWRGMWNPDDGTQMSILARKGSGVDLEQMADKLTNLPDDFGKYRWPGLSKVR